MEALASSFESVSLKAFAATAAISFIPNVILFAIPTSVLTQGIDSRIHFQHILLCFAAGALLGDVVIHTIPHLLGGDHDDHDTHKSGAIANISGAVKHEEEHNHYDMIRVGILVLLGFIVFFVAEKVASRHMHSDSIKEDSEVDIIEEDKREIIVPEIQSDLRNEVRRRNVGGHSHSHSKGVDQSDKDMNGKDKAVIKNTGGLYFFPSFSKLSPSGWLNLLADSMHNFTDGIALGASFSSASGKGGKTSHLGMAALFSIMFHEIPHELGDFSILIANGFSKWEAIRAQFITAIAAFLGTFLGLYAQRNETAEEIMLATTAGGFLYIATVSILPSVINHKSSLLQIFLETCGLMLGVAFMVAVAVLEEMNE